ncbi:MAG: undecaprenyl-diphosphate phosphatase [Bacilli bacterium]|nr:undecaprenyl-diphosphate phosphatase [Bacilli bacterium]
MEYIAEIIKYIIIGIVQGITEILPISSSGHLLLVYKVINITEQNQLNLTIFLHLASSIALCIYFKDKIYKILKGSFNYLRNKTNKEDFMVLLYLIFSSIPIAITGIILKPIMEKHFTNPYILSLGFFITSIVLLTIDNIKINNSKPYTLKNTLIIGLFQCLSVFPGVSRSGITLFGSKVSKLNSDKGKEFSFLLLIPISLGSSLLSIFEEGISLFNTSSNLFLYIISMIFAFIFTLLSLKIIFSKIKEKHFFIFCIYLLITSFLSLTLL